MILSRSLQNLYAATIDRSKFREVAQRILVFTLPLFYWGHHRQWWGFAFVAAGVLIRAWGAGYLKKDQSMAAGGPYLFVRHPLYLGSCLLALGLMVTIQHWVAWVLLGGVTFLTYFHTIRHEEKNLRARFGTPYVEYSRQVGPLWPKPAGLKMLFASLGKGTGSFSFRQYLKNKEYECLLGVIVVFLILYVGSP